MSDVMYLEYRIEIDIPPAQMKIIDKAITDFREKFNQRFKPIKLELFESENQTKFLEKGK